jgi:alpha-D-ribose 1-methylphosphonate 5-triphosphate synthase subunit PhnG
MERVDSEKGGDRTDAMHAASDRVRAVFAKIGERDAYLLEELCAPSVKLRLSATTWRGIVGYITGEENPHAQAAAVRSACVNLAKAYAKMERVAA